MTSEQPIEAAPKRFSPAVTAIMAGMDLVDLGTNCARAENDTTGTWAAAARGNIEKLRKALDEIDFGLPASANEAA